jgi:hypothetical protein
MYIQGIDPTEADSTAQFAVGQRGSNIGSDGVYREYLYVLVGAGGFTGDGYVVDIDGSTFSAVQSTVTTTAAGAGAGKPVGVARSAATAAQFAWVQIYGPGVVRVAASCAAYTLINSTATAGQLDDDATTGAEIIDGIVLDVANGGAAGTVAAFIQYPKVGRTL